MTRYRIYTELKKKECLIEYLASRLEGYTVFYCDGYWLGSREDSLVIEYIAGRMGRVEVDNIAHWIKEHNNQQSVLVTQEEVTVDYI